MRRSVLRRLREDCLTMNGEDLATRLAIPHEILAEWESTDAPEGLAAIGVDHPDGELAARVGEELAAVQALQRHVAANARPNPAVGGLEQVEASQRKVRAALEELRARAFAKVVVVETPTGDHRTFRITQVNHGVLGEPYGLAKQPLNVINRLSPVARQLVSVELGEELEPDDGAKGITGRVVAVTHLGRHVGDELGANLANFATIDHEVLGLEGPLRTRELQAFRAAERARLLAELDGTRDDDDAPLPEPRVVVRRVERLGSHFYTRTTKLQEALLQRPSRGMVIVGGVAGSGKTSVALGRAKVLCDRTATEDPDLPADCFLPEKSIGFVLNSELCVYLKEACQHLGMGAMVVEEYSTLRERLLIRREIAQAGFERVRYQDGEGPGLEGTMDWLRTTDSMVACRVAAALRRAVENVPEQRPEPRARARTPMQNDDLGLVWRWLQAQMALLADRLEADAPEEKTAFHLQGLAVDLDRIRTEFATRLRGRPAWSGAANRELRQNVRNGLRERIVRALALPSHYAAVLLQDPFVERLGRELEGLPAVDGSLDGAIARARARTLTDGDLDLLLALYDLVSVGYRGREDRDPISQLEETTSHSHVFIDEYQDFTEVQLFLMYQQAHRDRRAVTVVGDIQQRLGRGRAPDVAQAFPFASERELEVDVLLENMRQTGPLARLSQRFREIVGGGGPGELPPGPGSLPVLLEADSHLDAAVVRCVLGITDNDSIAVICADEACARDLHARVQDRLLASFRQSRFSRHAELSMRFTTHFTTARHAKGLEFDSVIVVRPEHFDLDLLHQRNALYVALSRPRRNLVVVAERIDRLDGRLRALVDEGLLDPRTGPKVPPA